MTEKMWQAKRDYFYKLLDISPSFGKKKTFQILHFK